MTKAELVEKAAKDAKISKVAAAAALNSFMEGVVRRKARKGRNPQTGAPIKIKATNVVKFRPGKKLRDSV
jgi:DNA-binding protein HU-beta